MIASGSGDRGKRLIEWFLRTQALGAARAQLPGPDDLAGRAFEQVRLLRAIARQFGESVDDPPSGRRPAVLLSLYRELVYWSLVADAPGEGDAPPDLAVLWEETPHDKLLAAARSERSLAAVHRLLVNTSPADSLDATGEDVARVRAFADALYGNVAAPRRRAARVVAQRWLRLLGAAAVLGAAVLGVRAVVLGRNLVDKDHMRISSRLADCAPDPLCAELMFHTDHETGPWVEFDLGKPTTIHVVEVKNRPDCCEDRAVPLVAEISTDHTTWKEVARQDKPFSTWKAKVPGAVTRYVRLRVARPSFFGLADVAIR